MCSSPSSCISTSSTYHWGYDEHGLTTATSPWSSCFGLEPKQVRWRLVVGPSHQEVHLVVRQVELLQEKIKEIKDEFYLVMSSTTLKITPASAPTTATTTGGGGEPYGPSAPAGVKKGVGVTDSTTMVHAYTVLQDLRLGMTRTTQSVTEAAALPSRTHRLGLTLKE